MTGTHWVHGTNLLQFELLVCSPEMFSFEIFSVYIFLLPHINIYFKIYQFNKIHGKGVGLQVRKLSYSPPPVQIINNQIDLAIQHI